MKITIDIPDDAAAEILGNIAIMKQWNGTPEEIANLLRQDIGKQVAMLARQGQLGRLRLLEQEAFNPTLAKITVS